jgi:nucleoside-diphosphate-sugar epimerase
MRALVTGGNGFIGSHLVEALKKRGYSVTCLIRKTSNLKWLSGLDVKFVYGDCTEKKTLYSAVEGADYVYHLAGVVRAINRETYYQVNFLGTKNLLEVCDEINQNIRKFVYLSTQSAAGPTNPNSEGDCHPITDYGKSKLKGEIIVNSYRDRLPVLIIRAPVIYGPRDKDIYTYFKFLKRGIKLLPKKGEGAFNALYVGDLVEGMILAAENGNSGGETYFIADEKSYSWREAAEKAAQAMGVKAVRINIPHWLILVSAFLAELSSRITHKPVLIDRQKVKEILHNGWFCNIDKAREHLCFEPRMSLEEGLKITVNWYRKNGWL